MELPRYRHRKSRRRAGLACLRTFGTFTSAAIRSSYKYLKSRKGRKLSLDEINHVSEIADSLAFTIAQMAKIDDAYRAVFGG
jgi:hypothetical protein